MLKVKKYLGLDWGSRRIGLAMADSETKMALPYGVAGSLEEIKEVAAKEEIDFLIVGQPLKMRGADLRLSREFLRFFEKLKKEIKLPIKAVDERLSSKAADALAGGEKNKAPRDAVAAMLILQTYLDREK